MNLAELMNIVNAAYPDNRVADYINEDGSQKERHPEDDLVFGFDGLAQFIVVEITETFDPKASDKAQLREAARVMDIAISDLSKINNALFDEAAKRGAK